MDVRPPGQSIYYSLIMILVTAAALIVASIQYTNNVQRQSEAHFTQLQRQSDQRYEQLQRDGEHKWCAVVTTLDDAWVAAPPTTTAGKLLARNFHQLRSSLGC